MSVSSAVIFNQEKARKGLLRDGKTSNFAKFRFKLYFRCYQEVVVDDDAVCEPDGLVVQLLLCTLLLVAVGHRLVH